MTPPPSPPWEGGARGGPPSHGRAHESSAPWKEEKNDHAIRNLCQQGTAFLKGASTSPALDAELLLSHLTKQPREFVLAHGERTVSERLTEKFHGLLRERRRGTPLAYLTGTQEFFGRPFLVTPAVMIPRPETETVAEEAIRLLHDVGHGAGAMGHGRRASPRGPRVKKPWPMPQAPCPIVADIGTGSGALAVTIALEIPTARVVAVDRSRPALTVARRNARRLRVLRRVTFFESDLLQEIPSELSPELIVANLPYITSDHLKHAGEHPDTRGLLFEPPRALDGGPDGLYLIRRFFAQFRRFPRIRQSLHDLLLEHSPNQRRRILELAHDALPEFQPHTLSPFVTRWTRRTP